MITVAQIEAGDIFEANAKLYVAVDNAARKTSIRVRDEHNAISFLTTCGECEMVVKSTDNNRIYNCKPE